MAGQGLAQLVGEAAAIAAEKDRRHLLGEIERYRDIGTETGDFHLQGRLFGVQLDLEPQPTECVDDARGADLIDTWILDLPSCP